MDIMTILHDDFLKIQIFWQAVTNKKSVISNIVSDTLYFTIAWNEEKK